MRERACLAIVLIAGVTACTHLGGAHRTEPALASLPPAPAAAPVLTPATVAPPPGEHASTAEPSPSAPAKPKPAGAAARSSAPKPAKDRTPAPSAHVVPAPLGAAVPAAVAASPPAQSTAKPQLDFKAMEQRLRDTSAIGVFTKLSIKNQVDDLLKAFREYHAGRTPPTLADLHQRYDGLLLKVVTLVQNDDATLASSISASRSAIWERLSNAQTFQAI